MEQYIFWGAWVLAFMHGIWRTAPVAEARLGPAWIEQCWAVAIMAVAAVLLNWLTTGDHLLRTLGNGYGPGAGVDLFMLASAAVAVMAALKLGRRAEAAAKVSSNRAIRWLRRSAPGPEALLLLLAVMANIVGLGWLALAMDVHCEKVFGPVPASRAAMRLLRVFGGIGLIVSLRLCLRLDHASISAVVWFMALVIAALAIAFTLTSRARWLGLLVIWIGVCSQGHHLKARSAK